LTEARATLERLDAKDYTPDFMGAISDMSSEVLDAIALQGAALSFVKERMGPIQTCLSEIVDAQSKRVSPLLEELSSHVFGMQPIVDSFPVLLSKVYAMQANLDAIPELSSKLGVIQTNVGAIREAFGKDMVPLIKELASKIRAIQTNVDAIPAASRKYLGPLFDELSSKEDVAPLLEEVGNLRQYCEGLNSWLQHLRSSMEHVQNQTHDDMSGINAWLGKVHELLQKAAVGPV